jgi:hypothetical protein
VPALACGRRDLTDVTVDEQRRTLAIVRRDGLGSAAACLVNLGDAEGHLEVELPEGTQDWALALATRPTEELGPAECGGRRLRVAVPPKTALVYVARV